MTFIVCSTNRQELTLLGQTLVALFPGCTIHQGSDPMCAIQRLSAQNVDAVFVDSHLLNDAMSMLKSWKLRTKIWLLRKHNEAHLEENDADYGVLFFPASEQEIREALQGIA